MGPPMIVCTYNVCVLDDIDTVGKNSKTTPFFRNWPLPPCGVALRRARARAVASCALVTASTPKICVKQRVHAVRTWAA